MTFHDVSVYQATCTMCSRVNDLFIYLCMMSHKASKPLPGCHLKIQASQLHAKRSPSCIGCAFDLCNNDCEALSLSP